jgi:hypothetical protein
MEEGSVRMVHDRLGEERREVSESLLDEWSVGDVAEKSCERDRGRLGRVFGLEKVDFALDGGEATRIDGGRGHSGDRSREAWRETKQKASSGWRGS